MESFLAAHRADSVYYDASCLRAAVARFTLLILAGYFPSSFSPQEMICLIFHGALVRGGCFQSGISFLSLRFVYNIHLAHCLTLTASLFYL
jgi:hypothetical protein